METPKLNLFQRLWLEILWGGMRLFAMLPYWFKYYVVENLFFCLLYYVLRYRRQVVWDNLRNSFPEKSERELWIIRRRSTARWPRYSSTRSTWPTRARRGPAKCWS